MTRLRPGGAESIDRSRSITFEFNGRTVAAHPGDTIGSALAASGRALLSRSFKYHRPRGLLCVSGKCPNCMMQVDGVPNVRSCVEPVRAGMKVRTQKGWPSLSWDWMAVLQWFDALLPVGFYYRTFTRPRWAWKIAEPVIRRLAGLGRLGAAPETRWEHAHERVEVLVVGGGPAGISAALAAARRGARVTLVDDQDRLGGHLRFYRRIPSHREPAPHGFELARRLADEAGNEPRIRVLSRALAFGAYEGGLVAVEQGTTLIHMRAGKLIVATGSFEYPPSFDGNDLSGILLASGARRLIELYGVEPGRRALLCGTDDDALALALDLADRGLEVAAVADARTAPNQGAWGRALAERGIEHLRAHRVVRALGGTRVRGVELARFTAEGAEVAASRRRLECDLLVLGTQYAPSVELLRQAGLRCRYDDLFHQMVPAESGAAVAGVGRLTGFRNLDIEMLQGEIAGAAAASGGADPKLAELQGRVAELEAEYRRGRERDRPLLLPDSGWQFVCLCEDVKQADVTRAVREGFSHLETLKRYSTISMGPCQGRMCLATASALCAERTGRTLAETGATTARPPVQPVPLGLLAGPEHNPVKLTPMHRRHDEAGAAPMDMGLWKRPARYSSEEEEWRAVRERVGLIDVSTLGKLDLRGRDAGALLDKVYTHQMAGLPPGRVRYGLIANDEGIILDDGTVSRLEPDRYFITTTTGNVEFVDQWLRWWLAGTGACAHVTNVTADFAAVNLAGPRARDALRKLTDTDLSPEGFRYMACRRAEVAGVASLLLRIGFVGETGWEIHYPACYGEYLWEALLEAGAEYGIRPFGVDAQRTLRLEKKHLIVGQDTDALSNPFEADLAWCIRMEKPDFIGKPRLLLLRDRPIEQKLVGFAADSERAIPEGSVVIDGGRPAGRVTSCRFSPYLNRQVGLAWVPAAVAQPGRSIEIDSSGARVSVSVFEGPFYDPEGRRLRE